MSVLYTSFKQKCVDIFESYIKMFKLYNYHTVVLFESPAIMSKIRLIPGIFSRVPNIGTLRRKFIATGRKPLE